MWGLAFTGWWLSHPSEKYEFVNWDDERNPIVMGKCKKWQRNHQPVQDHPCFNPCINLHLSSQHWSRVMVTLVEFCRCELKGWGHQKENRPKTALGVTTIRPWECDIQLLMHIHLEVSWNGGTPKSFFWWDVSLWTNHLGNPHDYGEILIWINGSETWIQSATLVLSKKNDPNIQTLYSPKGLSIVTEVHQVRAIWFGSGKLPKMDGPI